MPSSLTTRRNVVIVAIVLLLHLAGLWVLQRGLLARVAVAVPVQWVEVLTLPQPLPVPEPVKPSARPVQTSPQSRPVPQPTAGIAPVAAPELAAVADAPPLLAAPVGTAASASVVASVLPLSNAASRVELPSSDADYLHNPKPEYPRLSRQRNEQGKVIINVLIGTDGVAQRAEVKVSSGYERLDAAGLLTVKSWRFVPGKRGGAPDAMWFAVPINFVME